MEWYWILLIVISSLIGLYVLYVVSYGISMYFFVSHPRKRMRSIQFLRDDEGSEKKRFLDDYDASWEKEPFTFVGYKGYELYAEYIPSETETNKYVICTHGYTVNHIASVKYANIFKKLGYNIIIYDDRGHGNNKKKGITMGMNESKDLLCLINYVYDRFGNDIYLGLHGESMGSSTSLFVLKYGVKVKFVVSDCGYANCKEFFLNTMKKKYKIPALSVRIANIVALFCSHAQYFKVRPDLAVKERKDVPICFFHGEEDAFIPKYNSDVLFASASGYKELHQIPEAKHCQSIVVDRVRYFEIVKSFLSKID